MRHRAAGGNGAWAASGLVAALILLVQPGAWGQAAAQAPAGAVNGARLSCWTG